MDSEVKRGLKSNSVRPGQLTYEACDDNLDARKEVAPIIHINNLVTPTTCTEISRKSCIPSSVSLWNSLDNDIRTADSLSSFKSSIKSQRPNNSKVPPYFLSGDRYLSVQHARILNNSKSDLYDNHLCPSPMCSSKTAVEDAAHYFFHCPSFAECRIVLFQKR